MALFLGGCEALVIGAATPGIIKAKRVNLLNASYAAAETLAQQSQKRLERDIPLIVLDLQEIPDTSKEPLIVNPKVGTVISSQMRERFIQLGYTVQDSGAYAGGRNYGEVSGTYELKNGTMTVQLKMIDLRNGRIVGSYNYSLPITYDIKKYMTQDAHSLPLMPPLL